MDAWCILQIQYIIWLAIETKEVLIEGLNYKINYIRITIENEGVDKNYLRSS